MKRIILIFIIIVLSISLVSCTGFVIHELDGVDNMNDMDEISPIPEYSMSASSSVNLYYGYLDEQFLVCDTREIKLDENEEGEYQIIDQLIKGPKESNSSLTTLINTNTNIIDISDNDNYLFITLSNDFLSAPEDFRNSGMKENVRRYLAFYSIVNTIVEYSNYDYVQIFIDRDGTGSGSPITNEECGLSGEESIEPKGRNGSIILNEENTMREVMNSLESKDWSRLYDFIAYKDSDGSDRPAFSDFRNSITADNVSISDSSVLSSAWPTDGLHNKVFVDFTVATDNTQPTAKSDVSVEVVRERSLWKITYSEFLETFINN